LATLYDHLFETLDLLKESTYTNLEANIKRATAVRHTAQTVIEAAKLEVAVHKLKKSSTLDGLFPDLGPLTTPGKELGTGETAKQLEPGEKNPFL